MSEQWNPEPRKVGHAVTLAQAVTQALHAVMGGSEYAQVHDGLMAWLQDWADGHRAMANQATHDKMVAKMEPVLGSLLTSMVLAKIQGDPDGTDKAVDMLNGRVSHVESRLDAYGVPPVRAGREGS